MSEQTKECMYWRPMAMKGICECGKRWHQHSEATRNAAASPVVPPSDRGVPTPGPWKVYDDGEMWVGPADATAPTICDINPHHGAEGVYGLEDDANAHLIAAAPDLLQALKETVGALRLYAPGTPLNNKLFDAIGVRANAAIAKAEGQ